MHKQEMNIYAYSISLCLRPLGLAAKLNLIPFSSPEPPLL